LTEINAHDGFLRLSFGVGESIKGVAADIVTILTENEAEEPARAG
jgi:hypothetical protein